MVRDKRSQDMQPPDPYLRRQWGTSGLPLGRETAPNGLVGSPSANIDHGQGQHPSWLRRSWRPGARALTMTSLLLPSLLLILLINTYPLFYAAFQAVHNGSLISSGPFVGLSNFRAAIDDPVFWGAVRFTLIFTLAAVLGGWVIGFSLALLLWAPVPGRSVFRVLLLLPWIVPVVVSANSWNWLTATSTSVLPRLASALGFHNALFLANPSLARLTVCLFKIWETFPFMFLMGSAALESIDRNTLEAARVDGANRWQLLTKVTLPLIATPIYISWILVAIFAVNDFPTLYLLTAGGPIHATTTLVVLAYQLVFEDFQVGYGVAVAFIMTLMLVVLSLVLYRQLRKSVRVTR